MDYSILSNVGQKLNATVGVMRGERDVILEGRILRATLATAMLQFDYASQALNDLMSHISNDDVDALSWLQAQLPTLTDVPDSAIRRQLLALIGSRATLDQVMSAGAAYRVAEAAVISASSALRSFVSVRGLMNDDYVAEFSVPADGIALPISLSLPARYKETLTQPDAMTASKNAAAAAQNLTVLGRAGYYRALIATNELAKAGELALWTRLCDARDAYNTFVGGRPELLQYAVVKSTALALMEYVRTKTSLLSRTIEAKVSSVLDFGSEYSDIEHLYATYLGCYTSYNQLSSADWPEIVTVTPVQALHVVLPSVTTYAPVVATETDTMADDSLRQISVIWSLGYNPSDPAFDVVGSMAMSDNTDSTTNDGPLMQMPPAPYVA